MLIFCSFFRIRIHWRQLSNLCSLNPFFSLPTLRLMLSWYCLSFSMQLNYFIHNYLWCVPQYVILFIGKIYINSKADYLAVFYYMCIYDIKLCRNTYWCTISLFRIFHINEGLFPILHRIGAWTFYSDWKTFF